MHVTRRPCQAPSGGLSATNSVRLAQCYTKPHAIRCLLRPRRIACYASVGSEGDSEAPGGHSVTNRRTLLAGAGAAMMLSSSIVAAGLYGSPSLVLAATAAEEATKTAAEGGSANIAKFEPMDALKGKDYGKPRMTYKDYTTTPSGLQYQDLKLGSGESPVAGDTVVVDWDGYTIGYYGRPFEARNKPKGSSFSGDNKDFFRFVLGQGRVIPAFEEAVASMKPGGIRRIIVPVELGYPVGGPEGGRGGAAAAAGGDWRRLGPRPSTFAGERALDFVLSNRGMIDKTLLFDVELVRVVHGTQQQ
ncbi:hypothetical protein Agub_g4934 [Astrephomene gubernaculifera]|uniref:peptidylprolyl isomerase n=1 Tax=Astrephomene gubernaculifera TaxID=47775 RepID=A0AAD3DME1_9CHLO|nr:hypothetical protein Agub_g4934 [Astrephomene gubernaculifera]